MKKRSTRVVTLSLLAIAMAVLSGCGRNNRNNLNSDLTAICNGGYNTYNTGYNTGYPNYGYNGYNNGTGNPYGYGNNYGYNNGYNNGYGSSYYNNGQYGQYTSIDGTLTYSNNPNSQTGEAIVPNYGYGGQYGQQVEIDLQSCGFQEQFAQGRRVLVTGQYVQVQGYNGGNVNLFVVSQIQAR